jgi:hypothetical protein
MQGVNGLHEVHESPIVFVLTRSAATISARSLPAPNSGVPEFGNIKRSKDIRLFFQSHPEARITRTSISRRGHDAHNEFCADPRYTSNRFRLLRSRAVAHTGEPPAMIIVCEER